MLRILSSRGTVIIGAVVSIGITASLLLHLKGCLDEIHYGERQYGRYCADEGGLKVFERVSNIRGLLIQGAEWECPFCEYVLERRYEFVEFDTRGAATQDAFEYPNKPSLVRASLAPRSAACAPTGMPRLDQRAKEMNLCVQVEPISESLADAKVIRYVTKTVSDKGTLTKRWAEYRTSKDDRLIARDLWFMWWNKDPIAMPDSYLGKYACQHRGEEPTNPLPSFLIPAR